MMNALCKVALIGSFVAAGLLPVAAQDDVIEMEDVQVVGRATELTGIAAAASEGKVGQVELEARPILRTGEILEVIPGFIATQHSGTGKANQYFLRGFNLDHGTDFSAKVDGMPINLPTHGHGQGYLDLNHVIPELVEYVDFKKGPYYAEVGEFSSAGSAHIHLFDELPQGLVKLGIGADEFYRGVVANSLRLEGGILLGAFEVQSYDGPWVHPENGLKLNGLVKYTIGDEASGLRLSGMGYSSEWKSTDQSPLRIVQAGTLGRYHALNPTDGGETQRYSLQAEAWNDTGDSTTRGNAYVSYYDFDLWSDFTYFLDDPVNGDQFHQFDKRTTIAGELTHQRGSTLMDTAVDHLLGLQIRHDIIDEVGLEELRSKLASVNAELATLKARTEAARLKAESSTPTKKSPRVLDTVTVKRNWWMGRYVKATPGATLKATRACNGFTERNPTVHPGQRIKICGW